MPNPPLACAHDPPTGSETVIERAVIDPLDALVPTADAQTPLVSAAEVAVAVFVYVVDDVLLTVTCCESNADVTVNDDPPIEFTVPNVPPPPNPPRKPPPGPLPVPLPVPVGGVPPPGYPPNPPFDPEPLPVGGVPPPAYPPLAPPNGPCPLPAEQSEVLMSATRRAVTEAAPLALSVIAVTATQSPLASAESEIVLVRVKRVVEPNDTVVAPLVACTEAVDPFTDATLPVTAPRSRANDGALGSLPCAGVLAESPPLDDLPPPPPHAVATIAATASVERRTTRRFG
jgi:hypothetical protein